MMATVPIPAIAAVLTMVAAMVAAMGLRRAVSMATAGPVPPAAVLTVMAAMYRRSVPMLPVCLRRAVPVVAMVATGGVSGQVDDLDASVDLVAPGACVSVVPQSVVA
jgi:hypothetical protein